MVGFAVDMRGGGDEDAVEDVVEQEVWVAGRTAVDRNVRWRGDGEAGEGAGGMDLVVGVRGVGEGKDAAGMADVAVVVAVAACTVADVRDAVDDIAVGSVVASEAANAVEGECAGDYMGVLEDEEWVGCAEDA